MRFGLLGSLLVLDDGGSSADVGGAQPRTVLALLVAASGRVVTVDTLVDVLWGEEPPASAAGTLQSYISRLRRVLEPGRGPGVAATVLLRDPPGYRLALDAEAVDFRHFEHLADEGRALLAAGCHAEARDALTAADALWRGPALVEFTDIEALGAVAARLEERRLSALEDRVAADLALGRHAAVIGDLTGLVAANPLREGLRGHLALSLYRSGRQAEALRGLDDARTVLRDELGVELSRPLQELEAAILAHDRRLDEAPPAAATAVTDRSVTSTPTPTAISTATSTATPTPAPAPTGSAGFVGRRGELDQLRSALTEAAAGTVRVVIVEGEPGIGKTRLTEELSLAAGAAGALVQWGRAFEGGAAPAFWPWLPPLRALVEARAPGSAPLSPELAALVSPSDTAAGPAAAAELARFSLIEAVTGLLVEHASARPVMLVLDDLQWADGASLELLAATVARLPDVALLIAVTVRELEVGRRDAVVDTLAELTRRLGTRRLRLRGLDRAATGELVTLTTGVAVDGETAAAIHHRAEGNPFFTTELARLVSGGEELPGTDVPSGVRDVVRRRLTHLPAATLELLGVAAVVGRDADLALVCRVAGRDLYVGLDDLEPALVHRLLVPVADQPGLLRFAHALVREVLVEDLSPLRRARLHLRVADAMDDRDDLAEIVAEHLWNAVPIGVGGRAADALERAAQVAIRRVAYGSAQGLLERAVHLRRAAGGDEPALIAELAALAQLVSVLGASQGYASLVGSPLLSRGRQLAEQTGNERELLNLLWAEWAGLDVSCRYDRADPIARDLLAMTEQAPSALARVLGNTAYGIRCWHRGEITESARHLDRAAADIDLIKPEDVAGVLVNLDQLRLAVPFAAYIHVLAGDISDPEARFDEIVRTIPGNRYWELLVMNFAASSGLSTGDLDRSVRASRRGLAADPDGVSAFWSMAQRAYLGAALCVQGDITEGLAVLDDAWSRYTAMNLHTNGVTMLSARAHGLAGAGRIEEAAIALDAARRELELHQEAYAEPALLVADAVLQQARGDHDAARALLARAEARATAEGAHGIAAMVRATAARLGLG